MPRITSRVGHTDIQGDLGSRVASCLADRGFEATSKPRRVETMFLVPVHERLDRVEVHKATVDAAVRAGVQHIVYLSFLNTSGSATFTLARHHYLTEEHIRQSGVAFTFLRASAFHEVAHYLLDHDDVIRGPGGRGRVAFVGKDDVADVAVSVLLNPSAHMGITYDLTGPTALSLQELADIFAQKSGRPVSYVDETVEEAYESRANSGAPRWLLDAWVSTYLQIAKGELDQVTTDVQRLSGRAPVPLETYLDEHPGVLAKRT